MSNNLITKSGLSKSISPTSMLLMASGSIIGPFALFTSVWYGSCGPGIILSLALCAVLCSFIGLVIGELVAYCPFAGGEINYGYKAFGKDYAWWTAWWLLEPWIVMVPWMVIGITSILSYVFFPEVSFGFKIFLSFLLILIVAFVNAFKVTVSTTIQNILTASLFITGIGGTIIFFSSGQWDIANFTPFFQSNIGDGGFVGWFSGTAILVTIYFGFEVIPQLAEEGRYPRSKNASLMIGAILLAAGTYIIIAIGTVGMSDNAFLSKEPFAEIRVAKEILGYAWFAIPYALIGGVVAVATSGNGFFVGSMRLLFAMGQQNFMPRGFRKLNKNHVPIVANIFIAVISLVLLFALSENWLDDLFTIMAIGISVLYFMTCICSLKLNSRNDEEWQKRPWKVPGGNLTRFASIISSFLMIIGSAYAMTPGAWRMLGIYIGIGIVIYAGMKYQWKSNQDLQPWTPDVSWAEENERLMEQSLINDNETHSI